MMFYGTNIINVIKQKNRVKLWQTCVKGHSISPHLNELHMIQCTCWKADLNCSICGVFACQGSELTPVFYCPPEAERGHATTQMPVEDSSYARTLNNK